MSLLTVALRYKIKGCSPIGIFRLTFIYAFIIYAFIIYAFIIYAFIIQVHTSISWVLPERPTSTMRAWRLARVIFIMRVVRPKPSSTPHTLPGRPSIGHSLFQFFSNTTLSDTRRLDRVV